MIVFPTRVCSSLFFLSLSPSLSYFGIRAPYPSSYIRFRFVSRSRIEKKMYILGRKFALASSTFTFREIVDRIDALLFIKRSTRITRLSLRIPRGRGETSSTASPQVNKSNGTWWRGGSGNEDNSLPSPCFIRWHVVMKKLRSDACKTCPEGGESLNVLNPVFHRRLRESR